MQGNMSKLIFSVTAPREYAIAARIHNIPHMWICTFNTKLKKKKHTTPSQQNVQIDKTNDVAKISFANQHISRTKCKSLRMNTKSNGLNQNKCEVKCASLEPENSAGAHKHSIDTLHSANNLMMIRVFIGAFKI